MNLLPLPGGISLERQASLLFLKLGWLRVYGNALDVQASLLEKATEFRDENIHDAEKIDFIQEIAKEGWAFAWWCGGEDARTRSKLKPRQQIGVCRFNTLEETGVCIICGKPAHEKAYFAKAY